MAYLFTKDLETGNTLIDTQHKQLFDAINKLLDACAKGMGRSEIEETLDFLSKYVYTHFHDEEQLQQKYKYPDYIAHKKYHDEYKETIKAIAEELKRDGASIIMVSKVNTLIASWLINHIKRQDTKLAAHIRSVGE